MKKTIYRWRVRAGIFGIIPVIILSRPNKVSLLSGVGVCFIGLLLRAWASGYLKKEKELTVSGPYQYTRNPLYLGNFILGISCALGSYTWWGVIIFSAYFLLFYPTVIKKEKEKMKTLFPKKYEKYKKNVPSFFPSLRLYPSSDKIKFSWRIYRKNKEYRALIGSIVFWLILAGKLIL